MAGTYTRWYREGYVKVVNGSTAITGSDTYWLTAGLNPGDIFSVDGIHDYEILTITDNTHITLKTSYTGVSADSSQYHIIRNFTAHVPSQLAAQLADLYGDLSRYWDQDTQTIHGKSAYELAVLHGYVGTEAEWLEFLRNGGGFTDLVSKIEPITYHHAGAHNSIYRGKNLGTSFTPAMYNEIHNGTFRDLYMGDYLELPIDGTTKAIFTGFGLRNQTGKGAFLWFQNNSWKFPINDTNTLEGGYIASKMYTETLPALLEKIEAVIDPSYIWSMYDTLSDTLNSNGDVSHTTLIQNNKIWLPAPNNFAACASTALRQNVYKLTANANYRYFSGLVWPYALFAARPYYDAWFWSSSNYNASSWLLIGWSGNYCVAADNSATNIYTWPYIIIQ